MVVVVEAEAADEVEVETLATTITINIKAMMTTKVAVSSKVVVKEAAITPSSKVAEVVMAKNKAVAMASNRVVVMASNRVVVVMVKNKVAAMVKSKVVDTVDSINNSQTTMETLVGPATVVEEVMEGVTMITAVLLTLLLSMLEIAATVTCSPASLASSEARNSSFKTRMWMKKVLSKLTNRCMVVVVEEVLDLLPPEAWAYVFLLFQTLCIPYA
jgi:hypothetical protein